MTDLLTTTEDRTLTDRFFATRGLTESLAAPLSAEDQTVQSMPDVSPTKWHRAHTTWFFETFLLGPTLPGYRPFHPAFGYLFNSYYEGVGARYPRHDRGLVSRPGIEEIADYRRFVDEAMTAAARGSASTRPPSASSSWASTTSSSTRSCCSWTSSTCCRATHSSPPTTTLCPVPRRADCCFRLGRARRWGPPTSAMPVTASASTTSCPATRPSWVPSPWPTGR